MLIPMQRPQRILAIALCYTLTCFVCLSVYYDGAYKTSTAHQYRVLVSNVSVDAPSRREQEVRRNVSREILQLQETAEEVQQSFERERRATESQPRKINWREVLTNDIFKAKQKVLSTNDYRHFADNQVEYMASQFSLAHVLPRKGYRFTIFHNLGFICWLHW